MQSQPFKDLFGSYVVRQRVEGGAWGSQCWLMRGGWDVRHTHSCSE